MKMTKSTSKFKGNKKKPMMQPPDLTRTVRVNGKREDVIVQPSSESTYKYMSPADAGAGGAPQSGGAGVSGFPTFVGEHPVDRKDRFFKIK